MIGAMPAHKQFDESEALECAMKLFWARGFEATSIRELVSGMGINRASIYATYGDKRDLFVAALKRYDARHRQAWFRGIAERPGADRGTGASSSTRRSRWRPTTRRSASS